MDLKRKIRTYNFWISLSAAILIVLRLIGQSMGFVVDSALFMDIATAVCGVLVVLGIIIMPASQQTEKKKKELKVESQEAEEILKEVECCEEGENEDLAKECNIEEAPEVEEKPTEEITEETDKVSEQAVKLAIEELSKNPTELYELVKLLMKSK